MIIRAQDARGTAGTTLLEILIAMLIIGMVATGIVTAFIFSRRVTWRSSTELSGASYVYNVAELLRRAATVTGPIPAGQPGAGLTLAAGIYVDEEMNADGGFIPTGAIENAGLNLPADFQRFLTRPGTGPNVGDLNGDLEPDHGDGRLVVVEGAPVDANSNGIDDPAEIALVDRDGDGRAGLDLDRNGTTDLRRVRIRVKWTTPEA